MIDISPELITILMYIRIAGLGAISILYIHE